MIFLLLGAVPDGPSPVPSGPGARVQAMASARILQGEEIYFGRPASRDIGKASGGNFLIAPIRSAGEIASEDGQKIQLEEFH
ncbi:hypothetical protein [Parasphingorhabdus sp.]|uniref:hypothetical protein n=1 Tax=Parasphingorhabdus sp. TaxID=2709688 RepID=UPI003A92D2F4